MPTSRPTARALAVTGALLAVTAVPTATSGDADAQAPRPARPAPLTLDRAPAAATPIDAVAARELVQRLHDGARRARERRALRGPQRRLRLSDDGRAIVPADAPAAVRRLLRAANRINRTPYVWGGGHGSWESAGYDCSGSVGYVLHAAGVLDRFVTSGDLATYGRPGRGRWVTVYAHGGHTYLMVAGLRFDTIAHKSTGSRWSREPWTTDGYTVRHPAGL